MTMPRQIQVVQREDRSELKEISGGSRRSALAVARQCMTQTSSLKLCSGLCCKPKGAERLAIGKMLDGDVLVAYRLTIQLSIRGVRD